MSTPAVSIVVPNYNHANYLRERLDSIYSQTFRDFEVIILDDASVDTSREVIGRYVERNNTFYYANSVNSGSTFAQWALGVSKARGEYIWIAESDDFADKRFLETALEVFKNSSVGLVCLGSFEVDEKSNIIGPAFDFSTQRNSKSSTKKINKFSGDSTKFIRKYLVKGNFLPNVSALVFRRKALEGLLTEVDDFRFVGDWYLYILCVSKWGVSSVNSRLNYFRTHNSTTRRKSKSFQDWAVVNLEHARIFELLARLGLIGKYRKRTLVDKYVQNTLLNYNLERHLSQTSVLAEFDNLKPGSVLVWGAGNIGRLLVGKMLAVGVNPSRIVIVDKKVSFVRIVDSEFNVFQIRQLEVLLSCGHIRLICLATIAFESEMKRYLNDIGATPPLFTVGKLATF